MICTAHRGVSIQFDGGECPLCEANECHQEVSRLRAQLAATPDLYQACKAALAMLPLQFVGGDGLYRQLQAAITKAEGVGR